MSHTIDAQVRRRALHAARAVTLSMLASMGCSSTLTAMPPGSDANDVSANDVSASDVSAPDAALLATPDVTSVVSPDVVADVSSDVDAGEDCRPLRGTAQYGACCQRVMWDSRRGCEAWGPFMPPEGEV